MEQSANPIARLQTITRTIQAVTKDTSLQAYIRSLTAAAPSDTVFSCAGHKLTYLLTYLHADPRRQQQHTAVAARVTIATVRP